MPKSEETLAQEAREKIVNSIMFNLKAKARTREKVTVSEKEKKRFFGD